jgi:hypothetical protein
MKKLSSVLIFLTILLSKMIPFSWIIGSYHLTFSCTSMLAPVIAKQFGFAWISLFFVSKSLLTSSCLLLTLLHRTPLIFAAKAYKSRHWSTSFLLPAVCMLLFVSHDIGSISWVYSLYWLIPMALYFFANTIITRALSASFVAHGVGSVIWLYANNLAAPVWIGLIPVVLVERLLIAGGMLVIDLAITKVRACQPQKYILQKMRWA